MSRILTPSQFIAFSLLFSANIFAQKVGDQITFTTKDGKEHRDVKLKRISVDSIVIMSDSGMATIPYERLPEALAKNIGFDPSEAKIAREAQAANQHSQMAAQQEARNKKLEVEAQLAKAELRDAFVYRFVEGGIIFQTLGRIKDSDGERSAWIVPGTGWGYTQILDGRNTETEYHLEGVPSLPALVDDQPFSAYMVPNGTYDFGSSRIKSFKFVKWGGILYEDDQTFDSPTVVRKVE